MCVNVFECKDVNSRTCCRFESGFLVFVKQEKNAFYEIEAIAVSKMGSIFF